MRFLFTGGGTLGSVTPLLAVAEEIRAVLPVAEILWVGTADGPESRLVGESGLTFRAVSAGRFRRYFTLRNVADLWRIARGFFEARRLLREYRPAVVVSAGGFVAVPVVWAAATLKIPVHVHQLDLRPGLANRLSLPFARSLSVSFEKSLRDFRRPAPVWTGTPVRRSLWSGDRQAAAKIFNLESDVPTVLVTGGGTGAAALNDLVRRAAPAIAGRAQILHLTGLGKAVPWPDDRGRYRQREFLTGEMVQAYALADLVVTRAGIGALAEIAALGKPAVIVPIAGSHQEENAAYFAAAGTVTVDERAASPKAFAELVIALLEDVPRRRAMGAGLMTLTKPNAAAAVAALVLGLAAPGLTGAEKSAKVADSHLPPGASMPLTSTDSQYRPSPLSESERQAIRDFLQKLAQRRSSAPTFETPNGQLPADKQSDTL
ncbi:hypothetical protein A3C96_00965 [Candidatus Uhrbacteria bacterium RIFCSPHIGHO2_02_FULL_60_10]|uniref:UDP-N-acetylglucosamine--N-acetylmuramyl-(pentapeptide) pyrophosphoryl-undecaprenol N-acetylglucosamine transferase n=1 Tax=Candidatus Uhrbacteria bacterium RIFCSPHIGHO2_02_FULL_60_10 TaxID=1802392 RepID=A0A1F7U3S1_9BACT|nr:MAG: hypothetical protein A3C96_00965 [Candidatus Uhrbacteria bacterium RIFCSPHIGHO2_02_FULL_60_10]